MWPFGKWHPQEQKEHYVASPWIKFFGWGIFDVGAKYWKCIRIPFNFPIYFKKMMGLWNKTTFVCITYIYIDIYYVSVTWNFCLLQNYKETYFMWQLCAKCVSKCKDLCWVSRTQHYFSRIWLVFKSGNTGHMLLLKDHGSHKRHRAKLEGGCSSVLSLEGNLARGTFLPGKALWVH